MFATDTRSTEATTEVIHRFNDAFQRRDAATIADLVGDGCVMVSTQPAPEGTRYEGRDACVAFWQELATDPAASFDVEHTFVAGDWAAVRWRYRFGPTDDESVLGVNLTRVREGRIVEAHGYTKTPGGLPLPE